MKKIILLGDSIRLIGYGTKVPALLGEEPLGYPSERDFNNIYIYNSP